MWNKFALGFALLSLVISIIRDTTPARTFAAAQLPGTSITTGTGAPSNCGASNIYAPGSVYIQSSNGHVWTCSGSLWTDDTAAGVIPSGLSGLVVSGSCPSGFGEITALDAAMPYGTLAAHGDVGTTGGANTVTPAGTNSTAAFTPAGSVAAPVFTGTLGTIPAETIAWPIGTPAFTGTLGTVPAEPFTGSSVTTSAVSAGTPAGTVSTPTFTGSALATHSHGAGTLADATSGSTVKLFTASASGVSAATLSGSTAAVSAGTPAGTISTPTFAGSALGTHTHTDTAAGTNGTVSFTPAGSIAWPVAVPTNSTAAFTPAGSNSAPAFTGTPGTVPAQIFSGNSLDNRSAFVKVLFCQKT